MREVDDNGKETNVIWEGGDFDRVIDFINQEEAAGELEKIHLVQKTNTVNFEKIKDVENIREGIIRKLEMIMSKNHIDDDNTIGDYLAQEINDLVTEHLKYNKFGEDRELVSDLVQRWAYDDKSKSITNILKGKDPKLSTFVKSIDKKIDDKIGQLLDPIIEIFSRASIAALQNLSGIAASNQTEVSAGIKKKAEDAMKKIKEFSKKDPKSVTDFEKKLNYLETQLRRIEQSGGLEGIAPVEGVVFEYNGRLFKLTGNYLPVLKMINFFQFGRDK